MKNVFEQLKAWARRLRTELHAIYLAYQDLAVPWFPRVLAIIVVAYAVSPIDLIPDAIPILGYLDDLILIPTGIRLVLRLMPLNVMVHCCEEAEEAPLQVPGGRLVAVLIVGVWIGLAIWMIELLAPALLEPEPGQTT